LLSNLSAQTADPASHADLASPRPSFAALGFYVCPQRGRDDVRTLSIKASLPNRSATSIRFEFSSRFREVNRFLICLHLLASLNLLETKPIPEDDKLSLSGKICPSLENLDRLETGKWQMIEIVDDIAHSADHPRETNFFWHDLKRSGLRPTFQSLHFAGSSEDQKCSHDDFLRKSSHSSR